MNAGGTFIYLCFKKQKYSSLGTDDKIINKFGLVYNLKDCGNLSLVSNIDLNESAGGDDIYLCAGSDWNTEHKWDLKVEVKATYGPPVIQTWKVAVNINTEFDWTSSEGETKTTSDTEQIDYSCNAPAKRGYKCTAFVQSYKVDRTVTYYDGSKNTVILSSNFSANSASNIQFTRCCYLNCDSTENICAGSDSTSTSICPSVKSSSSMPNTRTEKMTLKFNPRVITDVKVVNSNKKTTSCPMGYEIVNSGCDSEGCDLNHKAGGDYIYLCLKKEYIQNIIGSSHPVNSYKIQISNDDCGSLKKAGVDLNIGAGGKYIYLCTGNDASATESPIFDFFVWIKGVNNSPSGYTCYSTDLNISAG
jgi:hypothetical protein